MALCDACFRRLRHRHLWLAQMNAPLAALDAQPHAGGDRGRETIGIAGRIQPGHAPLRNLRVVDQDADVAVARELRGGLRQGVTLEGEHAVAPGQLAPGFLHLQRLDPYIEAGPGRGPEIGGHPHRLGIAAVDVDHALATVAATEDSYTPVFDSTFMLYTQFHGLGVGEGSPGRALVAFAIPSVGLVSSSTLSDGRKLVPIRFRLNFFDQVSGESRFVDTTRTFAVRSLELDTFLSGHFEVPLGPGQWTMGLKAEQQAAGTGGMSRHKQIDVAGRTGLRLGDIVMGRPGAMPIWNSAGGPINLNPLNTWLSGGDLEIWFELAGLPGGTEFRTSLEVVPQARGKRGVTVELTDRAAEGVTSIRRTMELRDLEEGAYTLRVTVTAGGQSASRERPIQVVERD